MRKLLGFATSQHDQLFCSHLYLATRLSFRLLIAIIITIIIIIEYTVCAR